MPQQHSGERSERGCEPAEHQGLPGLPQTGARRITMRRMPRLSRLAARKDYRREGQAQSGDGGTTEVDSAVRRADSPGGPPLNPRAEPPENLRSNRSLPNEFLKRAPTPTAPKNA